MAKPLLLAAMAGVVAVALDPEPGSAQGLRMEPVDQASRDRSFVEYRDALLRAVRARDTGAVIELASQDILLSFGGDAGRESLRANLAGTENWQGEAYWAELQRVLDLGGVFLEDGAFCSPYLACLDLPGCPDCDLFETVFVTGRDIAARAAPDSAARIVARLSYDVLRMDAEAYSGKDWYPVHLPSGGRAFVSEADARMAVDYRARFEKIGGSWRMTVFIAGD
jgi:hypothetical protein